MSEIQPRGELSEAVQEQRFLTEVDHLLAARQSDGSFDVGAEQDVRTNLMTAVQEIAMPYAVTTTFQRLETATDETGKQQSLLMWLGRSAIDVAESGYKYHFSQPAFDRIEIEIKEARRYQSEFPIGTTQVFISPKMSPYDASEEIAKAEHLASDDAIRTSKTVVDSNGKIIGRQQQSLLVRDIPLPAWIDMFKDPNNIFSKAFPLHDEWSALSVMELFSELDLPDSDLPDGPVTLVEAVLPYIRDAQAKASVALQLVRFKHDQDSYRYVAETKADEWVVFEKELATSLAENLATTEIRRFIISLQHEWGEKDIELLENHCLGDTQYTMTRQLAARLEKAKQNLVNSAAAIQTGNDKVLDQLDAKTADSFQQELHEIERLRWQGASQGEIRYRQAMLDRQLASRNLRVGGGCPGDNVGEFKNDINPDDPLSALRSNDGGADKKNWKWKRGVCQVKKCPSPKPTEVGPCSVCRSCQHKFDIGQDPTKQTVAPTKSSNKPRQSVDELLIELSSKFESMVNDKEKEARKSQLVGGLALAKT